MNLRLHFLEANCGLARWRDEAARQTYFVSNLIDACVSPEITAASVDILVRELPRGAVPQLGIGGACFERSVVNIYLDTENPTFEASLADGEFGWTLAHELHHSMRYQSCGYGSTLGEAIVTEGLADTFVCELSGRKRAPWYNPASVTAYVVAVAQAQLESETYDHDVWFFGSGDIPAAAGYSIGFDLFRVYQTVIPDARASMMTNAPASELIGRAWKGLGTRHDEDFHSDR